MCTEREVVLWLGKGSAVGDCYQAAALTEAWRHYRAGRGRHWRPVRARYTPNRLGAAWTFYVGY